jgi:hypothetical protein
MAVNPRSEPFFPIMTLVVIVFILLGFGSAILGRGGGYVPAPLLIVHGSLTLSWFVLTLVQAFLIRRSNFALHKKLGWASLVLVLAMVVMGYRVTAHAMTNPDWSIGGMDNIASSIVPFFDILTFLIMYALGVSKRKDREAHKRLMVLAGIVMMDAAVARTAILLFGIPLLTLLFELAILLAFLVYDWRTRSKPHWVSVFGLVLFAGCMVFKIVVGPTESWAAFATAFFG